MMTGRDKFTADEIELLGIARWTGDRLFLAEPLASFLRDHVDIKE